MDIITEILETDKNAEERLESAKRKSEEILKDAEAEERSIKEGAAAQAAEYRSRREAETAEKIEKEGEKITAEENAKIRALDEAYENSREKWEREILDGILSI